MRPAGTFGGMRFVFLPLLLAVALVAAASGATAPPDGVIVFERRTGTAVADLYSIRPDGTGLRRLTRTQDSFDPDLSRDGRLVVFASHRTHGPGATELFVMRPDGTGLRRLTRNAHSRRAFTIDFDPAFSIDGRTVVFARTFVRGGRSSTDLFSVGVAGGPVRRLTYTAGQEHSPAFSLPLQLSFVRGGFVYELLGAQQVRTVAGADPAWSYPGHVLAYSRDGVVYRTGDEPHARVGRGTEPTWSPDGRSLAWVGPLGLVVDGRRLTRPGRLVHDVSPSWGPLAR